jgi:uncharacterized protein (DUF2141 family)
MRIRIALLLAGLGLFCSAASVVAHHSVTGEFDPNKTVTLKGVVTKIEWTNPHARIYIDVVQPNKTMVNWNLELAAVSALVRNGWTRSALKVGDTVTVEGIQARSGASIANARSVVLPDGRKVFSGAADQ